MRGYEFDMNIEMQLCGLVVLFLLKYFYSRHETVGLYSEKMFLKTLYITIISLTLDVLSVVMIYYIDYLPEWLVKLEAKVYLISLVLTAYTAFVYTSSDIYSKKVREKKDIIFKILQVVCSAVILILPIYISNDGRGIYTYGPSIIATYVGAVGFVFITLYIALRYNERMNERRRKAVITWMLVWVSAATIQFFFNNLLLVGFSCALGMVILFFELENPETYIDKKTGLFNGLAFSEYVKQLYASAKNYSCFIVSLEDSHYKEIQPEHMDATLLEVADYFRNIKECKVFKTVDKEFILVFEDLETMKKSLETVQEKFCEIWLRDSFDMMPLKLHPYYIIIESGQIAKDSSEFMGFLKYYRMNYLDAPENRCICLDESEMNKKRSREDMVGTIIDAIENDKVEVFYQPIYSGSERRFVSAEALVRIRRDDGSIIPPGLFIPIAEETDLISSLGEIVFRNTCRFIKNNDIRKLGMHYIEINLSVAQCESKGLAEDFIEIMEEYGVDPSFINLEITETGSIVKRKRLMENMNKLIDYGVTFSLDDFGNGQSNLNYIVDMPVQIVKFDRDMIQSYFKNEKAKLVLNATMRMVHDMGLKVVSEGVETKEQLDMLVELGIDYIQGYYFSKPLPADEFMAFMIENNK